MKLAAALLLILAFTASADVLSRIKSLSKKRPNVASALRPNVGDWESKLRPTPTIVRLLGEALILTSKKDSNLEDQSPASGWRYVNNPSSLRASLEQLRSEAHRAFARARGEMDGMVAAMSGVPRHLRNGLRTLALPSIPPHAVPRLTRFTAQAIERAADTGVTSSKSAEEAFQSVLGLTSELAAAVDQKLPQLLQRWSSLKCKSDKVLKPPRYPQRFPPRRPFSPRRKRGIFGNIKEMMGRVVKCMRIREETQMLSKVRQVLTRLPPLWRRLPDYFRQVWIKARVFQDMDFPAILTELAQLVAESGEPKERALYLRIVKEHALDTANLARLLHTMAKTFVEAAGAEGLHGLEGLAKMATAGSDQERSRLMTALASKVRASEGRLSGLLRGRKAGFAREIAAERSELSSAIEGLRSRAIGAAVTSEPAAEVASAEEDDDDHWDLGNLFASSSTEESDDFGISDFD